MNKRGVILVENVIFIILNVLFISILLLFLLKQGDGAIVLEQSYSKNVALLIDASNPVMEMKFNMDKGFNLAEKNGISRDEILRIDNERNMVIVKLSDKGGYEYSFFNSIDVTVYPDIFPEKNYIIKINGYK